MSPHFIMDCLKTQVQFCKLSWNFQSDQIKTFFGPGRYIFDQFGPREKKTGTPLPPKRNTNLPGKRPLFLETLKKGQNSLKFLGHGLKSLKSPQICPPNQSELSLALEDLPAFLGFNVVCR